MINYWYKKYIKRENKVKVLGQLRRASLSLAEWRQHIYTTLIASRPWLLKSTFTSF